MLILLQNFLPIVSGSVVMLYLRRKFLFLITDFITLDTQFTLKRQCCDKGDMLRLSTLYK